MAFGDFKNFLAASRKHNLQPFGLIGYSGQPGGHSLDHIPDNTPNISGLPLPVPGSGESFDGFETEFSVRSSTSLIVLNGLVQKETEDYTRAGTLNPTITFTVAPSADDICLELL